MSRYVGDWALSINDSQSECIWSDINFIIVTAHISANRQRGELSNLITSPVRHQSVLHIRLIEQAVRAKKKKELNFFFNKTLFTGPLIFNLMAEEWVEKGV